MLSKVTYRVVIDVYNWLLPLVAINILWFLMSLTIILLPPATAALYEIAYQARRGHGPEIHSYLLAVRRWAVRSWLWGLFNLVFCIVTLVAFRFYSTGGTPLVLIFCVAYVFIILLAQYYFWPYAILHESISLLVAARNSLFTLLGDPPLVIFFGLLSTFLLVISTVFVFPLVVITPVTIAFLAVYSLLEWLEGRGLLDKSEP